MTEIGTRRGRVLSGMRPTGSLHLGHYHGVLHNWAQLQQTHDCYFFVADWHALTTHYETRETISENVWSLVIDWMACGVDPALSRLFIQSQVPEHAELHLLLSMITPLGWLERVPTFKDQQEQLRDRDLATYGFLGYPLLQSADILIYRASHVPVGEDQVAHVELTREVARRFNHLFGREPDFEANALAAARKLGKKNHKLYLSLRRRYQESGDGEALDVARELVREQQNLTLADRERLLGWLDGSSVAVLPEPQAMLTPAARMPGLDGRKMSKSYGNAIALREEPDEIARKIRTMPTDPARVRRTDPGDPDKCPVFDFHRVYSDQATRDWVDTGCRSAAIGCLDCKAPVIEAVQQELQPIRARALELEADRDGVRRIVAEGVEAARETAQETLEDVRRVMGIDYR